jgi:hypothetical protein
MTAMLLVLLLMGRWAQPPRATLASHPTPPLPPQTERRVVLLRPAVPHYGLRRPKAAAAL